MKKSLTTPLSRQEFRAAFHVPGWVPRLYAAVAVFLIPWIIILSYSLPTRHLVSHWDVAWGGFDSGLFIAIAITAYLGFRRSPWIMLGGAVAGTLLVVDTWFDTLTAHSIRQFDHSIILALVAELPLAALSFWLAYRTGTASFHHPDHS